MERKTISIMKACELVGVSRRTIYNWLSAGKIEYVRTAGGSVRIFVDTLWRDPQRADRPRRGGPVGGAVVTEPKATAKDSSPAKTKPQPKKR